MIKHAISREYPRRQSIGSHICPRCANEKTPSERVGQQSYCRKCKAKYERAWRKSHPLTDDQRIKSNARSYASVYLKRGKINKTPCVDCGAAKVEMHHEDYSKPINVIFVCRQCHARRHHCEKKSCAKCGKVKESKYIRESYCNSCKSKIMRKWRRNRK